MGDFLVELLPCVVARPPQGGGVAGRCPPSGTPCSALPTALSREQILLAGDLADPTDAVERLCLPRSHVPVGAHGLRAIVDTLCPSAELTFDAEARARLLRLRLDELSDRQVQALETLDMNRRVMVTGGAGTGKTRLAVAWARRAVRRGERVLLTCYNDPLGWDLWDRLGGTGAVVGSFHQIVGGLDGMTPLDAPEGAGGEWWDNDAEAHLERHWPEIAARFDTIVIDEAQDFRPVWIQRLERLLEPAGRLLVVADMAQELYGRGFTVPSPDDGWVRCELTNNCRNSAQIAILLHRHLGGAAVPYGGPETIDVRWRRADDADAAVEVVGDEHDRFMEDDDRDPESLLVLTTTRMMRDRLREEFGFVAWEDSDEFDVVCETVHRAKGLEATHVMLVTADADVSDVLLYIGISRAVTGLTLVAPHAVAERLDLANG